MMDDDEELLQVIKKGRVHAEAWWREMGRKGLGAGQMNTGMYALQMRNRYNWFDANKQGENIQDMAGKLDRIAGALERFDEQSD